MKLSLVEFTQLLFVFFEIFRIIYRVAEKCEDVLHGDVKVVIDEEIELAPDTVFLAPSQSADSLDCVVKICVNEIELKIMIENYSTVNSTNRRIIHTCTIS